ncbi:hypothetical protein B0H14DRAFT_2836550 [Mycena olivaceomarginata]|nr:hypothetical protein B0H14DRAFT_2836550 [Mycena olivaceomarginata]
MAVILSPTLQRALFFEPDLVSKRVQNLLLVDMFPLCHPGKAITICLPIFTQFWRCRGAFQATRGELASHARHPAPTQTMIIKQTAYCMTVTERRGVLKDLSLRMGLLYDLTAPFIDETSFRIRWHNQTETEADLAFTTALPTFHSDGANLKSVEIASEKWNRCMMPEYIWIFAIVTRVAGVF